MPIGYLNLKLLNVESLYESMIAIPIRHLADKDMVIVIPSFTMTSDLQYQKEQ